LIAAELAVRPAQVEATIKLLDEGATVPFISRYRKEATGSLDEVQVTAARDRIKQLRELDERRAAILSSLDERGLLTDELRAAVDGARTMTELEGDFARAKLAASLLLTLPGLPFVYYGEEIGMTGDKPDERIRTPMPWRVAPGMGFTTGTPWEPLQDDSLTANVAVQDADPASLLNHYRRLIHLRAAEPALGAGDWVALEAGTDGVAAWLRREGDRVVMVVANLTEETLTSVTLSSGAGALASGRYEPVVLDPCLPNAVEAQRIAESYNKLDWETHVALGSDRMIALGRKGAFILEPVTR